METAKLILKFLAVLFLGVIVSMVYRDLKLQYKAWYRVELIRFCQETEAYKTNQQWVYIDCLKQLGVINQQELTAI